MPHERECCGKSASLFHDGELGRKVVTVRPAVIKWVGCVVAVVTGPGEFCLVSFVTVVPAKSGLQAADRNPGKWQFLAVIESPLVHDLELPLVSQPGKVADVDCIGAGFIGEVRFNGSLIFWSQAPVFAECRYQIEGVCPGEVPPGYAVVF